ATPRPAPRTRPGCAHARRPRRPVPRQTCEPDSGPHRARRRGAGAGPPSRSRSHPFNFLAALCRRRARDRDRRALRPRAGGTAERVAVTHGGRLCRRVRRAGARAPGRRPRDARNAPAALTGLWRGGTRLTIEHVLEDGAAKSRLWLDTGAIAVDMESA